MPAVDTCSEHCASPNEALAALQLHDGALLIDLDETLYLRNSTEDFIDSARPRILAALLLRFLDAVKPWRLSGRDTRDNWRAGLIALVFPWTWLVWRSRVTALARKHINEELALALSARPDAPIILTAGFTPIVTPLVAAMGLSPTRLIAMRLFSFADRRLGKLGLATERLGQDVVKHALVLTDSAADTELLKACDTPLRTVWPQAAYVPALRDLYLPGTYISQVKHPGEQYVSRGILQEDFAFWVLCTIGLATNPTLHFVGLSLLLLSFWCIYERGYVANDVIAYRYESDQQLTSTFSMAMASRYTIQPWIWALIAGAAGVAVLHSSPDAFAVYFAAWITVLALVDLCFAVYNRFDKQTRMWLYPVLQLLRTAAFAVIVPIVPAGIAALTAHVFSRWVPYMIYRSRKEPVWRQSNVTLMRLTLFLICCIISVASLGVSPLLTFSALALLLWNIYRAWRTGDFAQVIRGASFIDGARGLAYVEPKRSAPARDSR